MASYTHSSGSSHTNLSSIKELERPGYISVILYLCGEIRDWRTEARGVIGFGDESMTSGTVAAQQEGCWAAPLQCCAGPEIGRAHV